MASLPAMLLDENKALKARIAALEDVLIEAHAELHYLRERPHGGVIWFAVEDKSKWRDAARFSLDLHGWVSA